MEICVAVLDTFWGEHRQQAPRWFRINPYNHSGRRLYKLLDGNYHLLCTNACRIAVSSPNEHGIPNVEWLRDNLAQIQHRMPISLLLICGSVAKVTYERIGLVDPAFHVEYMMHPASRTWTRVALAEMKERIAKIRRSHGM